MDPDPVFQCVFDVAGDGGGGGGAETGVFTGDPKTNLHLSAVIESGRAFKPANPART